MALATYRKTEDLINIGAYETGSNPKVDYAIAMIDRANAFLQQDTEENVDFSTSLSRLEQLFAQEKLS